MGKAQVVPISLSSTVGRNPPRNFVRPRSRNREHLTSSEIDRLLKAARKNRWGCRDHALILVAFSHALRIREALQARWDDFDLVHAVYHVRRLKGSLSGDHPLRGVTIRALRQLRKHQMPG